MSATGYGKLRISTDVIGKIAKIAALEVEGVTAVSCGETVIGLLDRVNLKNVRLQNPVSVVMQDDVAKITIHIVAEYGCKVSAVGQKVQEYVKNAVQSMTAITVSRVDVVVVGVRVKDAAAE